MRLRTIVFVVAAAVLSGCGAVGGSLTNQQAGAVGMGVVGGLVGSELGGAVGAAAGAIGGIMLGSALGQWMDNNDRTYANRTLEYTPTGQTMQWHNPDTGYGYAMTPTRTYETPEGPCREYTTTGYVGGQPQQVYGTACRQPDGSWKTVSSDY